MIQKIFSYFGYMSRPISVLLLFLLFFLPPNLMALSSEKIAVLPFKIYMPKSMDYLVSGLQEMLTIRLAKEGFHLIDPTTINKSELSRIKVSELDFARKMGKEKGIDWIIKGSLTQIGKKISLDLTIIPISAEKRPFSIFVVGDSIDKIDKVIDKTAITATHRMKGIIQIDSISVKGNRRIRTYLKLHLSSNCVRLSSSRRFGVKVSCGGNLEIIPRKRGNFPIKSTDIF